MKKKIPQKLKDLVKKSIKQHSWNMGVSNYKVDILWMDENKEDNSVMAEMTTNGAYLSAEMKIYPVFVQNWGKDKSDEKADEIIAHEIAHILTSQLYYSAIWRWATEEETKDEWEALTEQISRLSCKLNQYLPKQKWKKPHCSCSLTGSLRKLMRKRNMLK